MKNQNALLVKYVRYADLMNAMQVSRTTIWRWVNMPSFPKKALVKRGSTVLINAEMFEQWLDGSGDMNEQDQ